MSHGPLAGVLGTPRTNLNLYVLGPGVGECQVVLFPDGRVMVVDACMKDDRNLGIALLEALGITRVDLFVVTHPDKDHVRGAGEFLRRFNPERVWVFPLHGSLRSVLVKARRVATTLGRSPSGALRDLGDFCDSLDDQPDGRVEEVGAQPAPWTFSNCGYAVTPVAPTATDRRVAGDVLVAQARRPEKPSARAGDFVDWVEDFLDDSRRRPADHPNTLSVALAVEFGERRLILGGDVEHHPTNGRRGWEGVRQKLAEPSTLKPHLLQGITAIKVPHHGSDGAICDTVWQEHRMNGAAPVAVIAPYTPSGLPRADGLTRLRALCECLAICTTTPGIRSAARSAGWTDASPTPESENFPMVAIEVPPTGPVTVSVWGNASLWTA